MAMKMAIRPVVMAISKRITETMMLSKPMAIPPALLELFPDVSAAPEPFPKPDGEANEDADDEEASEDQHDGKEHDFHGVSLVERVGVGQSRVFGIYQVIEPIQAVRRFALNQHDRAHWTVTHDFIGCEKGAAGELLA